MVVAVPLDWYPLYHHHHNSILPVFVAVVVVVVDCDHLIHVDVGGGVAMKLRRTCASCYDLNREVAIHNNHPLRKTTTTTFEDNSRVDWIV